MERKLRLTKGRVERALHDGGGRFTIYRDTELPGFGLRVTEGGAKSFIAEYRRNGRKHRVTVGRFGPLTVDEARDEAKAVLFGAVKGEDPIEKRRREREGETLQDVADRYLADLEARARAGAKRGRLSSHTWASGVFRRHVPDAMKRRRAADVTADDVKRAMKRLADAGHAPTADHLRTVLHAVLEVAKGEGLRADNPVDAVKKYKKPPRKRRAVTLDELSRLGPVLQQVEATGRLGEHRVAREAATAIRLLVLTGMRRSELLGHEAKKYRGPREGLRWGDVDLDAGTYSLQAVAGGSGGKGGEPRVLPLGRAAVELLESIRPEDVDPEARVVDLVALDKPRDRMYAAAGIVEKDPRKFVDGHSLRKTFETTCWKLAPTFAGMLTGRAFTKDATLNDYIDPSDPEMLQEAHKAADAVAGRIADALDGKLADVLAFQKT